MGHGAASEAHHCISTNVVGNALTDMRLLQILLICLILLSCRQEPKREMIKGIRSCNADSICAASYYFGEQGDRTVVKQLLTGIEDVRVSHDIRHKGMSVYYCKMGALRKISGLDVRVGQTDRPDSIKIRQFIEWAADNELINKNEKIDTRSCVN